MTVIAVGALVLVVTAVIMTQKPEWMVAQVRLRRALKSSKKGLRRRTGEV